MLDAPVVQVRHGGTPVGGGATGTYTAVLDDRGELVAAVSDMAVVDQLRLETVHLSLIHI